jgi:L-iditol 2-dehydrogenase
VKDPGMKAALFTSIGQLTLTQVERPAIDGPDEVLIQVKAVGICGSEIHAFKGTHPFRKPPSLLGHEVTGQVVEIGDQVKGLVPGDRVFVDPQWPCGSCQWCRSGQHNLCPSKKVLGTPEWSGGLGEYIVAPERSVYPLPAHISYVAGTLIEPLSVAVHMVEHVSVARGQSVVILGAGPIGMMVAATSSLRGGMPIVAVDLQSHCLDVVRQYLGATYTLLGNEEPIAQRVLDITSGKRIDVVFLTVGVPALVDEALRMVERGGRIMFVALFDEPITLYPNDLIGEDLTLLGSSMYNVQDIRSAIDLIAGGQVRAETMVTHVLPLAEAQRGFELAATKADGAIKVVLQLAPATRDFPRVSAV